MTIKTAVKGNYSLYSLLKIARDIGKFPASRLWQLDRLRAIHSAYPSTMLPPVRLYSFMDAVDDVNARKLDGSIVECGVWSGGALAIACLWDEWQATANVTISGFDSFEGLPPPTENDPDILEAFKRASAAKGRTADMSLQATGVCVGDNADTVRIMFARAGVPPERTHLHAGWFQDTLPKVKQDIGPIAILRLDGDYYESTKTCLDELYDQVVATGYVIIDDYGRFEGCKAAVDECRAARGVDSPLIDVDGQCMYFRKP